ncbi:MAG TPA: hypothetical protein VE269_00850 [Gaiellaceae bacterium]|nr:hypothetical protein [Gaiellaceae bacterium]
MPKFELRIDGEKVARVDGEEEVRDWIADYRAKHELDDPDATHVQIVKLRFAGGELVPVERFRQRRGG